MFYGNAHPLYQQQQMQGMGFWDEFREKYIDPVVGEDISEAAGEWWEKEGKQEALKEGMEVLADTGIIPSGGSSQPAPSQSAVDSIKSTIASTQQTIQAAVPGGMVTVAVVGGVLLFLALRK